MSCVSTVLALKSTQVNPLNLVHNWESFDTYCKLPISSNMQQELTEQEEKRHFENEYERTRKEALERMKQAQEKRKAEGRKRAEELRKQMEELKLKEEEVLRAWAKYFYCEKLMLQIYFLIYIFSFSQASHLKKEQEALLLQQWELEKIEEERVKAETRRKKSEMG